MIMLAAMAIGGAVSAYGAYRQGKAQRAMANYNARVIEEETKARRLAIKAEQQTLVKGQRKLQAKQRMSVAARGGLAEGTDLMTLADQASEMQMDVLEMQRQQDITSLKGASAAAMSRYEGKQAYRQGKWTAASKLIGTGAQMAAY